MNDFSELLKPKKLWEPSQILRRDCAVPKAPGVYAWYFKNFPLETPTAGCVTFDGWTLLYVGTSPKEPPKNGRPSSRQTLYSRIRKHIRGNASVSTLRLSLGCLLSEELDIQLRRVGSGKRMTFAKGEEKLSEWLEHNARVIWMITPEPWKLEQELIETVFLPLNLEHNEKHDFHDKLSAKRESAKKRAREMQIIGG